MIGPPCIFSATRFAIPWITRRVIDPVARRRPCSRSLSLLSSRRRETISFQKHPPRTHLASTVLPTRRQFQSQAGTEPGLDPNDNVNDGDGESLPQDAHTVYQDCTISVHDFSPDRLVSTQLNNTTLAGSLAEPRPKWASARWINVDGISWDVVRVLGQKEGLHRLAVEDLMNRRNRTKVDWYPEGAFVILTLQRLTGLDGSHISESRRSRRRDDYQSSQAEPLSNAQPATRTLTTLRAPHSPTQRHFLSQHSPLTQQHLAIQIEQIALFLLSDNTILTFFEHPTSSASVSAPILTRLESPSTILRHSADAGMVMQAVLDTVIDLAIPCVQAYEGVIAELEVEVLRAPNVGHSKQLYVLSSELQTLRAQIQPIISVINALRDHHGSSLLPDAGNEEGLPDSPIDAKAMRPTVVPDRNPSPHSDKIAISRLTHTYLGDVLDHAILLTTSLTTMSASASSMISLVFSSMSFAQNETLKQLSFVTILFLPLTFLSGYFGMNFEEFPAIKHSDMFFWSLAAPITIIVALGLGRKAIYNRIWRGVWKRRLQAGDDKNIRRRGSGGSDQRKTE